MPTESYTGRFTGRSGPKSGTDPGPVLPRFGSERGQKPVDLALREVQAQAILDVAKKAAQDLSQQPVLFAQPFISSPAYQANLYAYPLANRPLMDGYGDEWRHNQTEVSHFSEGVLNANLQIGVVARSLSSTGLAQPGPAKD